ncbi:MAG TPA: peptidoglycan-associated lipoprotein Pal [Geomonas sp.]|nr:peptidoglycan-associated lipoprotein Pal [Geomonas sp.]
MRTSIGIYLALGAAAVACSAGCAKHEMVKQDQMIPPAATAAKEPVKPAPAPAKSEAKESGIATSNLSDGQGASSQPAQQGTASLQSALEKIYFDFDSSTLSSQARQSLTKNADLLKKNAGSKIRIEGNCDELGSDDYNLALGERRAKAAREYLGHLGVAPERMSTISYGKEKPADPGHDEAARTKNRRDELVVVAQ